MALTAGHGSLEATLPSVETTALPTIGRRWTVLSPPPLETLAECLCLWYRDD